LPGVFSLPLRYEDVHACRFVQLTSEESRPSGCGYGAYFRTAPRFKSGDPRYACLNQSIFVAEGRVGPGRVEYRVYRVAKRPAYSPVACLSHLQSFGRRIFFNLRRSNIVVISSFKNKWYKTTI
jgi:hypothetical protein